MEFLKYILVKKSDHIALKSELRKALEENRNMESQLHSLYPRIDVLEFQLRKKDNLINHLQHGVTSLYPDVFPVKLSC